MIPSKLNVRGDSIVLFRSIFFFLLLVVGSSITFAQQTERSVTGKVTDVNGEPMIGVTIMRKNSDIGTITDINGNYTVNISVNSDVLTYSYIGFTTVEQIVGNRTSINVTLEEDDKLLDEVVVVGYGSMKKRDVSGAISQVAAEKFYQEIRRQVLIRHCKVD